MNVKSFRKAIVAPSALLCLSLGAGVRVSAAPRAESFESKAASLFRLLSLEELLESSGQGAEQAPVAEGGTTARFGALSFAPLLTFSRLFSRALRRAGGGRKSGRHHGAAVDGRGRDQPNRRLHHGAADRAGIGGGIGVAIEGAEDEHEYPIFNPQPTPDTIFSPTWPPNQSPLLPRVKRGGLNAQSVGAVNFRATGLSASGYYPPDTDGAVGPTQILVDGQRAHHPVQ